MRFGVGGFTEVLCGVCSGVFTCVHVCSDVRVCVVFTVSVCTLMYVCSGVC